MLLRKSQITLICLENCSQISYFFEKLYQTNRQAGGKKLQIHQRELCKKNIFRDVWKLVTEAPIVFFQEHLVQDWIQLLVNMVSMADVASSFCHTISQSSVSVAFHVWVRLDKD